MGDTSMFFKFAPPILANEFCRIANCEQTPEISGVCDKMQIPHGKRWLMLHGGPGKGKSTMLRAMRNIVYGAKTPQTFGIVWANAWDDELVFNRSKHWFFIDDLGVEPKIKYVDGKEIRAVEKFFLDAYSYEKTKNINEPTSFIFFSTNLTPAGIRARYGERIADRMNELCAPVNFDLFFPNSFRK